jgi:16S rRNA (cytidine1402-2'-O)-methyltransferase
MKSHGRLLVVATPIGNLGDITLRALEVLRTADVVVAEDTRHSRKLFSHFDIPVAGRLVAGHEHNEAERSNEVVAAVAEGKTVALISDAGTPAVSDPGARIVAACIGAGLTVEAVPGASAALAGLIVSGLPTERFVFEGFLPRKGADRAARLAALADERRTTVIFESPRRTAALLRDLEAACGGNRSVVLARELTKLHEEVWRGTLADAVGREFSARGEYVVVLGPAEGAAEITDPELDAALRTLIEQGVSVRDAAAEVSEVLGVAKRRAYERALALRDISR